MPDIIALACIIVLVQVKIKAKDIKFLRMPAKGIGDLTAIRIKKPAPRRDGRLNERMDFILLPLPRSP